ncbi:MAG TPA: hypothetical protein VFL59_14140 [Candidatus Nanopelagicales bacterium]|nr:hypothetical protein [Candidatus Nanopelagicales bacterium]
MPAVVGGLLLAGCGSSSGTTGTAPSAATSAIHAATSSTGLTYLDDGAGHALYVFAIDSNGRSRCTGSCLTYWPIEPATAAASRAPGVTAALGTLVRPDGARQLTIDGLPAYTYVGDTAPGSTAGQGLNASGGLWWLIDPSGHAITTRASPSRSAGAGMGHGY